MITVDQKEKLLKRIQLPCENCGCSKWEVDDDAIAMHPYQPGGVMIKQGYDPKRIMPFAVVKCKDCRAVRLFPWGEVFGFTS